MFFNAPGFRFFHRVIPQDVCARRWEEAGGRAGRQAGRRGGGGEICVGKESVSVVEGASWEETHAHGGGL